MSLSTHDVAVLDAYARAVGERIHWEMHFQSDGEFAGVTAGARQVFIVGPARIGDLIRADVESVLDALKAGTRYIVDRDGCPHLI